MSRFKKAERTRARLRLALDGPAGSGKSFTALRFAFAFPGARVACVEAGENGGLSLYQGEAPDGTPFDFDILELRNNFSPAEYTAAIQEAGRGGYDVLVIDSLSHAWAGAGGALDQVGGASFTDKDGWRKVTPQHNAMIDAILQSPCHVIATLRTKTEYVIEKNDKGRDVPRKVGMAPIQRAGMEYEFTLYGSMDPQHNLQITKSRCSALQDALVHRPGAAFVLPLIEWLSTGAAPPPPEPKAGAEHLRQKFGVAELAQLTAPQADELEAAIAAKAAAAAAGASTANGTVTATATKE